MAACTCSATLRRCPACLAYDVTHPHGVRRPPVLHQASHPTLSRILTALEPPGTWHTTRAIAHTVAREQQHVCNALRLLAQRGQVQRRGTARKYEYALPAKKEQKP